MAQVYDERGQLVDVPDEDAQAGIAQGRYGLDPGVQYRVVWGDGVEETLDAQRAIDAVQSGRAQLRIGAAAAAADARLEAQRRETSRTPLEGAAVAALGAVDAQLGGQVSRAARERQGQLASRAEAEQRYLIEQGLSPEEAARAVQAPEDVVAEASARHPAAYALGTAAGMLGPGVGAAADTLAARLAGAAAGQGTGAAAFGAAARELLGAAGGGEALAGQAIERFVAGRGAASWAARGAGFGAEGVLSGVRGYATAQQATGTPFSAEQLAASGLLGGALGLGAGWLAELGGAGASAVGRFLRRADRPRPGVLAETVERTAEGRYVVPRDPANPYYDGVTRLQALMSGIDPAELAPLTNRGFRDLMNTADSEIYEAARSVARVRDISRTADDMLALAQGPQRLAFLRSAAADAAPEAAGAARLAMLRQRNALAELSESGAHMLSASARSSVRSASEAVADALGAIGDDAGAAFAAADGYAARLAEAVRRASDPAAAGALQDLHASMRQLLEDPLWGGAAVARQQLDSAVSTLVESSRVLDSRLGGVVLNEAGETTARGVDASRVQAWFGTLHDPRSDETWATLHRFFDDFDALDDTLRAQGFAATPAAAEARGLGAELRQLLQDKEPKIVARATLRRLEAQESSRLGAAIGVSGLTLGRAATGALIGGTFGGLTDHDPALSSLAGAALGGAFGAMTRPVSFYRQLSALDRVTRGVRVRFNAAMSGVRARISGATALARTAGRVPVSPLVAALTNAKTRQEAYVRMRQEAQELAATPAAVAARVGNATDGYDESADPTVVPGLAWHASAAAQLLDQILPPLPDGPWPTLRAYTPSATEYSMAVDLVQGLEDPVSVLEEYARTGRVNWHGARAMEAVYPGMFDAVRNEIFDLLTDETQQPRYQTRLDLGRLLNVPTDRSLEPQLMDVLQARYAQTRSQARAQGFVGPQVRSSGARAMRAGASGATATQSLSWQGPAGSWR